MSTIISIIGIYAGIKVLLFIIGLFVFFGAVGVINYNRYKEE